MYLAPHRHYPRTLLDALILFALVCGAFWKLTLLGDQFTWANQSDMSDQVLPWLQFQAREWHAGRPWPLWDPNHWGGQSLIGQIQPGVMYPLNWLLFLAAPQGRLTIPLLGWYLVLARYMGALFFYWLARDCGRSRLAAIFGGMLFACTGYAGTTDWPQVLNGAIWGPVVLLFGLRLFRHRAPKWADAAAMGAALGMSVLAGHYQVPFHFLLLAGCLVLAAGFRRVGSWKRAAGLGLTAGIFAFLIAAAQLLPAREYWRGALRWVGAPHPLTWAEKIPFSIHQADSLDPVSIVGVVVPRIYSALSNPYLGFAGAVLAILAVIGVRRGWRSPQMRLLIALTVVFTILSFGAATWLYSVAYAVLPGFEKSRHPATAVAVWHMCLVLLACFGIDRLRRMPASILWRASAALAAFAVFVYGTAIYLSLADPAKVFGRKEQTMAALAALLLAGVFAGYRARGIGLTAARVLCLGVGMIEVSNVAGYGYADKSTAPGWDRLAPLTEDADIVAFLESEPGFVRVDFDRAEIPYNFGDWWGKWQYQGYTGVPEALFRRVFETETRQLLGQSHWMTKAAEWNGQKPAFRSQRGVSVFRVEGAAGPLLGGNCRSAAVAGQHPGYWRIESTGDGCAVVLNEAWDAGWKGTLDGASVPIQRHKDLLKSVVIPPTAGPAATPDPQRKHVIELRYQPAAVRWGVAMSLAGVLSLIVLRRKR